MPVFLVQAIGGTVYSYLPLAKHLAAYHHPVHSFRSYGLEAGERPDTSVSAVAARNIAELRARRPTGPYVLGGHSSGGLIAHEMAHQLLRQGHEVPAVILIDTVPVSDSHRLNLRTAEDVLAAFSSYQQTAPRVWEAFRAALNTDLAVRDVVVATNQAIVNHVPSRIASGLLYIRADERDNVLDAHPEWSWAQLFHGDITIESTPGNHFTLLEPRNVNAVARSIHRLLNRLSRDKQTGSNATGRPHGTATVSAVFPSGLRIEGIDLEQAVRLSKLLEETAIASVTDSAML